MARNKAQTMIRLVQAAGEVIVEQGIDPMGIKATATRAGVDKNLVYRYFRSWNGILETLFAHLLSRINSDSDTGSDTRRIDALVTQETYILAFSQLVRDNPAFRVLLHWQRDHSETQLGQRLTELLDESIQGIAGLYPVDVGVIRLLIAGVTNLAAANEPIEPVIRYLFAQLRIAERNSEPVGVSVNSYPEPILTT